jgi:hypothetical protein
MVKVASSEVARERDRESRPFGVSCVGKLEPSERLGVTIVLKPGLKVFISKTKTFLFRDSAFHKV